MRKFAFIFNALAYIALGLMVNVAMQLAAGTMEIDFNPSEQEEVCADQLR